MPPITDPELLTLHTDYYKQLYDLGIREPSLENIATYLVYGVSGLPRAADPKKLLLECPVRDLAMALSTLGPAPTLGSSWAFLALAGFAQMAGRTDFIFTRNNRYRATAQLTADSFPVHMAFGSPTLAEFAAELAEEVNAKHRVEFPKYILGDTSWMHLRKEMSEKYAVVLAEKPPETVVAYSPEHY